MGLIPLIWLAILHFRGKRAGIEWWWLAGAFAVSWLADTAAHWTGSQLVGAVYPVSQSAIIGAVLLSRSEAIELTIGLVAIGVLDVYANGITGPDILLRTVAWLSIVGIVYPLRQLERLRMALIVSFGVGWVCWLGYAIWPGWSSWGLYQTVRLAGILLFCWASLKPSPRLRVISA
jgi:hypothetical protein